MNKFLVVFSSLIISFGCFSQKKFVLKGKVISENNAKPLKYVNIMVLNKALGASSSSDGSFSLPIGNFSEKDTLVFSHLGYKTLKIPIAQVINSIVKLRLNHIELPEVILRGSKKKIKPVTLNKFRKGRAIVLHSPKPFNGGNTWVPYRKNEPAIETIYFPYNSGNGEFQKIKEVLIKFKTYKDTSKVILRVFNATKDYTPLEDILPKPIILQVTKEDSFLKINLEKYNIYMPETGIFIGVEYLIIPENVSVVQNTTGVEATLYSPFLNYITTKEDNYHYFMYSKGNWSKISKKVDWSKRNMFYKPAISLILEGTD